MTKEQLNKEKILTKITLNDTGSKKMNPQYRLRLENKLKMIEETFKIKTGIEMANYKFIGLPSYDIRVFNYFYLNLQKVQLFISKTPHSRKCLLLMSLFHNDNVLKSSIMFKFYINTVVSTFIH